MSPLSFGDGVRCVLIEGAGIAGQVLHRELARRGISSVLKERASFPRDKVCGGILQPESWEYLRTAFSLDERAEEVPTISHFWRGRRISRVRLPRPLIFVPRIRLDAAMFKCHAANLSPKRPFGPGPKIESGPGPDERALTIRATGAHARGPWIGFQAQAAPVDGLEMHYGRGIYMGVSPAEGGHSHAAFIVRKEKFTGDIARLVKEELGLELLTKPKGTGQIHYGDSGEPLAVGDAKMTTHPFLGLGMKHAILSARLMADCIEKGKPDEYPARHRRLFARMRRASAVSARLYESGARVLLWPLLAWRPLFIPAYRWLHREPVC